MTSIDICLCTYQRDSLLQTLQSLDQQVLPANVTTRIIVADNDATPSAHELVTTIQSLVRIPIHYIHAPERNISIARNACLDAAKADWVAFIDDDEVADPHWLNRLLKRAETGRLTAVFGPGLAEYEADTPNWIRTQNYHSNMPQTRHGVVQTGHTCNALMRRQDRAVTGKRFMLSKGRTGGEDTAFFFSIFRDGGRFGICDGAIVHEAVEPSRLSYEWIARRRFRAGQSYGYHSAEESIFLRIQISVLAVIKSAFCWMMTALTSWSEEKRNFWSLRGIFHAGVVSSFFHRQEEQLY